MEISGQKEDGTHFCQGQGKGGGTPTMNTTTLTPLK